MSRTQLNISRIFLQFNVLRAQYGWSAIQLLDKTIANIVMCMVIFVHGCKRSQ